MNRHTLVAARVAVSVSIAAVFSVALAGCGSSSEKAMPVEGRVSYKDSPIAKGAIMFFPERGRPTTAATDEAGRYSTELSPGHYKVTVNMSVQLPPGWKEGDPIPPRESQVAPQYTTRLKTPLTTTVTTSTAEPTNFDLP